MFNLLLLALVALCTMVQARPQAPSLYFTWKDCGQDSARPLRVHSISISPDPIYLPGTAVVSYDVESTAEISNLDLAVTIKKNTVIGEITVPCINKRGSCTYTDLCQYTDRIPGMPISCPAPAGRFTENNIEVPLPDPGNLGSILAGSYSIKAYFSETGTGREMGCFEVNVTLKT